MKMLRWAVVVALLLVALVLALAARDALSWRSALSRGDKRLASAPANAQWRG
jgi:hypothetical protein